MSKTPITDSNAMYVVQDGANFCTCVNAEVARRLEEDRAALIEALRELLDSKNITECPHGLWSTADPNNYYRVVNARALLSRIDGEDK